MPLAQFPAGPATVTPYLGVNVQFSGQAEAGAQVSIVAPFNVSAALSKLGGPPTATATERPSFQPEIGLPDAADALAFTVSVEVEVTMTFMLSINGSPGRRTGAAGGAGYRARRHCGPDRRGTSTPRRR